MKKSDESDKLKLNSIIKSISNIKKAFTQNQISNVNNLKNDELTQAACTQLITNIQEAKKKLQDETYNKLIELNKIKLAGVRNIASHDYDSLDFSVIYYICRDLIKANVLSEVYAVLADIEKAEEESEKQAVEGAAPDGE